MTLYQTKTKFQEAFLNRKNGFTVLEVMLAVLMLSLLFGSAYGVMRYSRSETEKGFWIQSAITQLRNGTRMITSRLKQTSYPSTIIKDGAGNEKVISFKEKRSYDATGRLRDLKVNDDESYEMHVLLSGSAPISPGISDQTLMYFPICTPEKDVIGGYEEGTILWVELQLRAAKDYKYSGLGDLYIIERTDTYNTKSDPDDRAFGLSKGYSKDLPLKKEQVLVSDVREVEIDSYDIKESRGIYVTKSGQKYEKERKKILLSMEIACRHPKDKNVWLSDQCSIINNVDLVKLAGSKIIELVKVIASGPSGSVVISINGVEKTYSVGSKVGEYEVSSIQEKSVGLVMPGSDIEKFIALK